MRKLFIIAGEASGDLHGSNLIKAFKKADSKLEIQAYGGPKMALAGAKVVRKYEDHSFMGFYEVAKNIRSVLSNLKETKHLISDFSPDAVIFIDFPSFNLRIAKFLKNAAPGVKLFYYISPKVWAWKSARVHTLNKLIDEIFVIFPFEKNFYAKYGYEVTYVGNPLLDEIKLVPKDEKRINLTAILPGSRQQEIVKMLPIFATLANEMPEQQFEVSVMDHFPLSFYRSVAGYTSENVKYSTRSTYDLLAEAGSAIVTSGTATLETALFNTPQVVVYKTSGISYRIAKMVVRVKYISLVNLILDRPAIKELIQNQLTVYNLKREVTRLISKPDPILGEYKVLRELLGEGGASNAVVSGILNHFQDE